MPKRMVTMYLHGSKESNWDLAQEIGLSEAASTNFMYALYEVAFEVEVDEETGDIRIVSVDGRALRDAEDSS